MTVGRSRSGARAGPAWRVLRSGPGPGASNLAVDEALFLLAGGGQSPPTLRFYGWSPPAVSVGYFQNWDREIDAAACRRKGLGIYRRMTGGRAVLHRHEVTYSIVCSRSDSLLGRGLVPAYRSIAGALCTGLRRLGVEAEIDPPARGGQGRTAARSASCFSSSAGYEITAGGRKLVGSAQKRQGHVLLQHGSILLSNHGGEFEGLLKPEHRSRAAALAMTSLEELLGGCPPVPKVIDALLEGFLENWGIDIREGYLSEKEASLADDLRRSKYGSCAWNGSPGQKFNPAQPFAVGSRLR